MYHRKNVMVLPNASGSGALVVVMDSENSLAEMRGADYFPNVSGNTDSEDDTQWLVDCINTMAPREDDGDQRAQVNRSLPALVHSLAGVAPDSQLRHLFVNAAGKPQLR